MELSLGASMSPGGEGVGGNPEIENELDGATMPTGGAPKRSEGGFEIVCRLSLGGDGENGREAWDMDGPGEELDCRDI